MIIDVIFVLFLVSAFVHGFRRGLIQSLFAFVALFFGLMLSVKFSHELSVYLYESFSITSKFLPFLSFILIFIGVLILFRTLSFLLQKAAETLFLGFVNKIVGAVLWCIIITMIFSTVLWYLNQMDFISLESQKQSHTYEILISFAPTVIDFFANLIPYFKGMFEAIEDFFRTPPVQKGLQACL